MLELTFGVLPRKYAYYRYFCKMTQGLFLMQNTQKGSFLLSSLSRIGIYFTTERQRKTVNVIQIGDEERII